MADRGEQAAALQDWMTLHRVALHKEHEVGLDFPDTHKYVADALRGLGLLPEVHAGAGVTVEVAGLSGGRPVVLRAPADA